MTKTTEAGELGTAKDVVRFWSEAGPGAWFGKSPRFDEALRTRFLDLHVEAASGHLEGWMNDAEGALALLVLLDQFPRNAFRGTPRMYATDALARYYADKAISFGFDRAVKGDLRLFFYLPFSHSENIEDQERSVLLHEGLGYTSNAVRHRDIVRRFGRFPHRNPILGRAMRPEEQAYLDDGGFAG